MDKRKNNKGTIGNKGGGRLKKSMEQEIVEKLGPMSDEAHSQLNISIVAGEPWAIKLWFEYFYGKPKQSMDVSSGGEPILITITEVVKDGS